MPTPKRSRTQREVIKKEGGGDLRRKQQLSREAQINREEKIKRKIKERGA